VHCTASACASGSSVADHYLHGWRAFTSAVESFTWIASKEALICSSSHDRMSVDLATRDCFI
jgi:hypothetical protein